MEDDGPPGVPEWVVTYGDMMSLLLTFFIMLVSLSEVIAEKKYRAVLEALDQRLNGGYATAPLNPPGPNYAANDHFDSPEQKLGSQSPDDTGRGGVHSKSTEGQDIRIKITDEGTPQRVGGALLFEAGTRQLTADSEAELLRIARILTGKPNKIEIRSHASPEAIQAAREDGFELTYQRGEAVLELLTQWGLNAERIRITAASDALPAPSGTDRAIPADRIEIYTTDVFSTEYVGPRRRS